jgi:hypothetical protein
MLGQEQFGDTVALDPGDYALLNDITDCFPNTFHLLIITRKG